MSYEEKKKRLSELTQIPSFAQLDHRFYLDKDGNLPFISKLSKNERKKLDIEVKKIVSKYSDILKKIKQSGAGFPVDKLLRELAIEYTHRYAASGINTQPLSFNYFESFCNIRLFKNSISAYAVPINEVDHLFNITDFFDYLTSNKSDDFDLTSLLELPEDTAFHFTTNGDVLDFTLLNADGKEFVISGFSMVRRRNSLHWYLVGGEIITDQEWELKSIENTIIKGECLNPLKRPFLAESAKENDFKVGAPIALEGTKTAIRTIIAGEIDLITQEYLGKCLMHESENTFDIICDDPEIFDSYQNEERQEHINSMKRKIEHVAVMWDLAASMFQLHSYFAYKINITKNIVIAAGQRVSTKSKGGRGTNSIYKTVSTIDIIDDSSFPIIRPVIPPHYKTNIEGYWRRLPYESIGKGPDGSEEKGRTWVKRKNEWRETNEAAHSIIYVKSTIKAAELKAIELEKAAMASPKNIKPSKPENGILYVLRCTIMKEEIYKVGWTSGSAKDRAEQISSATGVPTSFVVVEFWEHANADGLEKNIHMMLDPYRINDRREFFQADYRTIKKIIEAEIQRSSSVIN